MSTNVGQRLEVWVNIEGIKPKVVSTVVNDGVLTINLVEILFPKAEEYLHNNVKMFTSDGTRIRLYEKISDLLASGHGNKDAPLKIWIPSMLVMLQSVWSSDVPLASQTVTPTGKGSQYLCR